MPAAPTRCCTVTITSRRSRPGTTTPVRRFRCKRGLSTRSRPACQSRSAKMTFRTFAAQALAAGAAMTLLAGPAWAACEDDIQALDEQVVAAETGAAPADGGLPATEHQQEVLSGNDQAVEQSDMHATQHQQEELSGDSGDALETGAGPSGAVAAPSPHQRQAGRDLAAGTTTQASDRRADDHQQAEARADREKR